MQIHEITKLGKKRTDEGILDSFKQAVGITPKPGEGPTKFQKMTNPSLAAVEKNKKALGSAAASIAKLKAQGYDVSSAEQAVAGYSQAETPQAAAEKSQEKAAVKDALNKMIQQVQTNPQTKQVIDNLDDDFAMAMPGYELKVHSDKTNGDYYKDETGQWWNDDFPRQKVAASAAAGLEQLAAQGKAKEVQSPAAIAAKQAADIAAQKKGGKKPAQAVTEAKGDRKLKTAFYGWVRPKIETVKGADGSTISLITAANNNPQLKTKLHQTFMAMLAANDQADNDEVKKLFKDFVTIAIAGLFVEKNKQFKAAGKPTGDDEDEDTSRSSSNIYTNNPLANKVAQAIDSEGVQGLIDILGRKDKEEANQAVQDLIKAGGKL